MITIKQQIMGLFKSMSRAQWHFSSYLPVSHLVNFILSPPLCSLKVDFFTYVYFSVSRYSKPHHYTTAFLEAHVYINNPNRQGRPFFTKHLRTTAFECKCFYILAENKCDTNNQKKEAAHMERRSKNPAKHLRWSVLKK